MEFRIDVRVIKRYVLENKKKCFKMAGLTLVLIIALAIAVTNNLTSNKGITVIETSGTEIAANEDAGVINEIETAVVEDEFIVVDIDGAVRFPGVVILRAGSRVNDAVEEAGGLTGEADTRNVNLASKLSDGDKIYIPQENEESGNQPNNSKPAGIITNIVSNNSHGSHANSENNGGMVNINTATSAQLQTLNGVGPVTAQKIIEYRNSVGSFAKIEDIMRVSGIGTKTFDGFKDKIFV